MDPTFLKRHLEQLCDDLDHGRRLRRPPLAAMAALGVALSGCPQGGDTDDTDAVALYAAAFENDCGDEVDNDADGLADCDDPDCVDDPACATVDYGVPFEADCDNKIDDDKDGLIDCDDPDCADVPPCSKVDYAAPFE